MGADDEPPSEDESPSEQDAAPTPETRYGAPVTRSRGQLVLHPSRQDLVGAVEAARDDGFVMCVDVTAVDYLQDPLRDLPESVEAERFEVVVSLISHQDGQRLRLRVQVPEQDPSVPSLFHVHPGTEALEREVHDMFGIAFDGHPDLTRILMPEDWVGHPLRKDYAVGEIPVQFKNAPAPR